MMTRDDVAAAVRAWARWSPLLPMGFVQSMKIRNVRDAELPAWVVQEGVPRDAAAGRVPVPVTLATIEYNERDYEVVIVGVDRTVHINRPPRAWLRIALIAGLAVTALGLLAGRWLQRPPPAREPARSVPAATAPPAPTVLCPGCDGKGCSVCGNRGRLPVDRPK